MSQNEWNTQNDRDINKKGVLDFYTNNVVLAQQEFLTKQVS